jgi:hypothetical protein
MARLDGIRAKVAQRQYEFSQHAVDRSIRRGISVAEVEEAIAGPSEVIEDCPDAKYGPSCLVLGFTAAGRPLHIVCSHPSRPRVKIITLYEPKPEAWDNWRVRRAV